MRAFLSAVLLLAATAGPAAAENASLQSSLSHDLRQVENRSFVTLSVENDLFGGGTDRNYTNGVRLTYFNLGTPMPDFARTIDRLIPTFSINDTTSIFYSFGQNLYTPKDLKDPALNTQDRPWAGFAYVSAGLFSVTDNHTDLAEATVGVIGPAALGEQVQKFIHRHVSNSPMPKGWRHQLENEPGLMLSWERRWPERYEMKPLGWMTSAVPYIGATVGNVYTYASTGLSLRLAPKEGGLQDEPVRVRPAMPGTGAFVVPDDTFSWYLFSGVEGRAVAQNIFLDGNTFTDSHSVDKKPLVADATAGIAITYGAVRTSYALVYRTREFDTQDKGDVFGTVSLGLRF